MDGNLAMANEIVYQKEHDFEPEEIWEYIPDHEGLYQVSNFGRIKRLGRIIIRNNGYSLRINELIMKIGKGSGGYSSVNLRENGTSKTFMVHRLVAIAFIPNPENKPEVNHKDGNKSNNNVWNLEWATRSENEIHAYNTGIKIGSWLNKFGIDNPGSKPINQFTKTGEFIQSFYGISDAARKTGVERTLISGCCRNRTKTANGFKWKYACAEEILMLHIHKMIVSK